MNTNSGYVFLTDEDFNVAMLNGDRLERWYVCPECGQEGFAGDMDDEHKIGEWFDVQHGADEDELDDEG